MPLNYSELEANHKQYDNYAKDKNLIEAALNSLKNENYRVPTELFGKYEFSKIFVKHPRVQFKKIAAQYFVACSFLLNENKDNYHYFLKNPSRYIEIWQFMLFITQEQKNKLDLLKEFIAPATSLEKTKQHFLLTTACLAACNINIPVVANIANFTSLYKYLKKIKELENHINIFQALAICGKYRFFNINKLYESIKYLNKHPQEIDQTLGYIAFRRLFIEKKNDPISKNEIIYYFGKSKEDKDFQGLEHNHFWDQLHQNIKTMGMFSEESQFIWAAWFVSTTFENNERFRNANEKYKNEIMQFMRDKKFEYFVFWQTVWNFLKYSNDYPAISSFLNEFVSPPATKEIALKTLPQNLLIYLESSKVPENLVIISEKFAEEQPGIVTDEFIQKLGLIAYVYNLPNKNDEQLKDIYRTLAEFVFPANPKSNVHQWINNNPELFRIKNELKFSKKELLNSWILHLSQKSQLLKIIKELINKPNQIFSDKILYDLDVQSQQVFLQNPVFPKELSQKLELEKFSENLQIIFALMHLSFKSLYKDSFLLTEIKNNLAEIGCEEIVKDLIQKDYLKEISYLYKLELNQDLKTNLLINYLLQGLSKGNKSQQLEIITYIQSQECLQNTTFLTQMDKFLSEHNTFWFSEKSHSDAVTKSIMVHTLFLILPNFLATIDSKAQCKVLLNKNEFDKNYSLQPNQKPLEDNGVLFIDSEGVIARLLGSKFQDKKWRCDLSSTSTPQSLDVYSLTLPELTGLKNKISIIINIGKFINHETTPTFLDSLNPWAKQRIQIYNDFKKYVLANLHLEPATFLLKFQDANPGTDVSLLLTLNDRLSLGTSKMALEAKMLEQFHEVYKTINPN